MTNEARKIIDDANRVERWALTYAKLIDLANRGIGFEHKKRAASLPLSPEFIKPSCEADIS